MWVSITHNDGKREKTLIDAVGAMLMAPLLAPVAALAIVCVVVSAQCQPSPAVVLNVMLIRPSW